LKRYRKPLRVAAVGDGGNDVSMIQAAHAGIGIDAHEGRRINVFLIRLTRGNTSLNFRYILLF
jgi:P-type E1-E2 ATPase